MVSRFGEMLANFAGSHRTAAAAESKASVQDIDQSYAGLEIYSLGVNDGEKELRRRDRRTILTTWAMMQHDPTIAAALNLHVTAALGGHESRGDVVFMSPASLISNGGKNSERLRKLVEQEAKHLVPILNQLAFPLARYGFAYGDSFARVYGEKNHGLVHVMCNEYTEAPLIQAYEQGGRTVGFHVLERDGMEARKITELTTTQMVRMKMPRYTPVPQFRIGQHLFKSMLGENDINKLPLIPAEAGGSILYDAEEPWANVQLILQALNSQQVADSVKQGFLTIDVSGMPPQQRNKYQKGLTKMLQKHKDNVRSALQGGETVWSQAWHVLPVWGDKQVLSALGDLSQRGTPLNTETLMINVRRMCGALGMDLALLGWAEQLAGGLGDGAAFHTSAQIGQKSIHIRTAITQTFNDIVNLHFGYKYGFMFKPHEIPWKFEFYSDISAATTEALTSKQTRSNTLAMFGQSLSTLKDLQLDRTSNLMLLSKVGGCDDEDAVMLADSLEKTINEEKKRMNQQGGGFGGGDGGFDNGSLGGDGDLTGDDPADDEE